MKSSAVEQTFSFRQERWPVAHSRRCGRPFPSCLSVALRHSHDSNPLTHNKVYCDMIASHYIWRTAAWMRSIEAGARAACPVEPHAQHSDDASKQWRSVRWMKLSTVSRLWWLGATDSLVHPGGRTRRISVPLPSRVVILKIKKRKSFYSKQTYCNSSCSCSCLPFLPLKITKVIRFEQKNNFYQTFGDMMRDISSYISISQGMLGKIKYRKKIQMSDEWVILNCSPSKSPLANSLGHFLLFFVWYNFQKAQR